MKNKIKIDPSLLKTSSVVGAIILAYVCAFFVPLASPFARFPLYLIKCGGVPITATKFASSYSYDLPGDRFYGVTFATSDFFCSEKEAQAAGYKRNPLSY